MIPYVSYAMECPYLDFLIANDCLREKLMAFLDSIVDPRDYSRLFNKYCTNRKVNLYLINKCVENRLSIKIKGYDLLTMLISMNDNYFQVLKIIINYYPSILIDKILLYSLDKDYCKFIIDSLFILNYNFISMVKVIFSDSRSIPMQQYFLNKFDRNEMRSYLYQYYKDIDPMVFANIVERL